MTQAITQMVPSHDYFPAAPGAYALIIRLERRVKIKMGRQKPADLAAGIYIYCGSARGPGGLRARLNRHLKKSKAVHWHVDQLTTKGNIIGIWAEETANECRLADTVMAKCDGNVPLPGFGSSDCRTCIAHLAAVSEQIDLTDVFRSLGHGISWTAQPAAP